MGTECHSLPEWVQSSCVYQRSQSCLVPGDPWCSCHLSWLTLEAKINCSQAMSEAKTISSTVVRKAKTTRGHMVQEAEATFPKPSARLRPIGSLQAELLYRECGSIMWDLRDKSSKRRAEVKLTSSLPVRLSCTAAHWSLKASWLLPTTSYWGKHLHCLHSPPPQRTSPMEEQLTMATPPTLVPKQSHRPKRTAPFTRSCESTPMGGTTQKATPGYPPAPRGKRPLPGSKHSSKVMPRHLAKTLTW